MNCVAFDRIHRWEFISHTWVLEKHFIFPAWFYHHKILNISHWLWAWGIPAILLYLCLGCIFWHSFSLGHITQLLELIIFILERDCTFRQEPQMRVYFSYMGFIKVFLSSQLGFTIMKYWRFHTGFELGVQEYLLVLYI